MKNLVLNICKSNIKVVFHKASWEFAQNKIYEDIRNYYGGFLTEKYRSIDYYIEVFEEKRFSLIIKENHKRLYIKYYEVINSRYITFHHISFVQFQLLLITITLEILNKNNAFVLHSSGIAHNNKAEIFIGDSGSGKSTIMNMLKNKYIPIADDSVIINKNTNKNFVYQTPFVEKEYWMRKNRKRFILDNIFFIVQAPKNRIVKIFDKKYLLERLIKATTSEKEHQPNQIKYIMEFLSKFSNFYFFYFNKKIDEVENELSKLIRI
jgi:hypothetical protein